MKAMNHRKYKPFPIMEMKERNWPSRHIVKAPEWCSVDLRDGNQALNVPMNVQEKIALFELLVDIGFKQIEVGFPSASETEFAFVRKIIEENRIPEDVTVQILTQSREHLIKRSFEALKGVKNAIIHLYNSTSSLQRDVVFGMSREQIKAIAVNGARLMKDLNKNVGSSHIRFEYSPESFTGTEPDYALEVCHAVMDVWEPSSTNKVILNLPSTVEMSTPNVYADLIEWFCTHLKGRENAVISLHTHNDRGTAVAAAELALLAGADRVEGTLFGNGERTGNMDIVTMALNLFSQGIPMGLDFSNISKIMETYTKCTRMSVHERHPYAGEWVYTAFSGSHQDAISKGMRARKERKNEFWEVPYLPLDPEDVGRNYESIIRINSQSGKGGVAFIMEQKFGFRLPKPMHPEFGAVIQKESDARGSEILPDDILKAFEQEYLKNETPYALKKCHIDMDQDKDTHIEATVLAEGKEVLIRGKGNGPIDSFAKGLGNSVPFPFMVKSYFEHALDTGADSKAVAYIEIADGRNVSAFGAGIDENISVASIKAVVSALNRLKKKNGSN